MQSVLTQLLTQLVVVAHRVGWAEVVDVAVVALILYQVMKLLRGTQGFTVLIGLVVLAIVGVLARTFNLVLLSFIFQNPATPTVIALAVIVMFQPELRRALDQMGRLGHLGRPLTGFNQRLFSQAMHEAIRAAEKLSSRHQGAIIAFEREVGLEDYAATGVRLNGEISAEVLQSIFYPNSPLHDGAVIVRGNRILAAGCLLPLAEEGSVRERLGTRHRAAIGLSLSSDALILVVSEESGAISVVEDGKIARNLDGDGLRKRVSPNVAAAGAGVRPLIGLIK